MRQRAPLKAKQSNINRTPLKASKPMRRVSERRKKENKLYTQVRNDYLATHPRCECCIKAPATEIHHRRGRWKSRLTDITYFLAICRPCHDRIHHNPEWAYATGLMLHR
jgi:hypothetical protein